MSSPGILFSINVRGIGSCCLVCDCCYEFLVEIIEFEGELRHSWSRFNHTEDQSVFFIRESDSRLAKDREVFVSCTAIHSKDDQQQQELNQSTKLWHNSAFGQILIKFALYHYQSRGFNRIAPNQGVWGLGFGVWGLGFGVW